jgi:hypothetical protein
VSTKEHSEIDLFFAQMYSAEKRMRKMQKGVARISLTCCADARGGAGAMVRTVNADIARAVPTAS